MVQPTSATISRMRYRLAPSECATDRGQPELAEVDRREHDQQRQQRQRDHRVSQPHQQGVGAAAGVACDQTDRRAEQGRGERADQADEQRHLPAIEQAQQQVAAELVGAERMLRAAAARSGRAGRPRSDRDRARRRAAAPPALHSARSSSMTPLAMARRWRTNRRNSRRRGEAPGCTGPRAVAASGPSASALIGDPRVEPGVDHVGAEVARRA